MKLREKKDDGRMMEGRIAGGNPDPPISLHISCFYGGYKENNLVGASNLGFDNDGSDCGGRFGPWMMVFVE